MPVKIASSPSPEIEAFVVSGGTEDLAAANILSFCIETESVILVVPLVVQLQPVFAIGELAPTVAPRMVLT